MHDLQKALLKRLSNANHQKFGSLTRGYDYDDNVVFHLKQLIANGFLAKQDGAYSISLSGVKEIAKYEPVELLDKGVKTFFLGFVCTDGERNYLIKSHPQARVNFYNLPSGKPFFGEKVADALVRTFQQNTQLQLAPDRFEFLSLHLKTITSEEEVIFDDAFAIYNVQISKQEKEAMHLPAAINWLSAAEISELSNKWPEIDKCILSNKVDPYEVYSHVSTYIL